MIDPRTGKRGPTIWLVNQKLSTARRLYAAGNYRRAAKLARTAFHEAQQVKAWETQEYVNKIAPVVDCMEGINELVKALVEKHREGKRDDVDQTTDP